MDANEQLSARLIQLQIGIDQVHETIKKAPKENPETQALEEMFNHYIHLTNEFRNIEKVMISEKAQPDFDYIKTRYANVKALLNDTTLEKSVQNLLASKDCITRCTDCITSCTECVTNACVQCVINGSGNLCGLSSLTFSPCRPKVDIGDQMMRDESIEQLEIMWKNKN